MPTPRLQALLQSEARLRSDSQEERGGGVRSPVKAESVHQGSCLWPQPEQCFWEAEVQVSLNQVTGNVHKLVSPVTGTQWTPNKVGKISAPEL